MNWHLQARLVCDVSQPQVCQRVRIQTGGSKVEVRLHATTVLRVSAVERMEGGEEGSKGA